MNAIIRDYDSRQNELAYIQNKYGEWTNLIDRDARHVFPSGFKCYEIKCAIGFNHYGKREKMINPNMTDKCDVCGECESWVHILTCVGSRQRNAAFIGTLTEKL